MSWEDSNMEIDLLIGEAHTFAEEADDARIHALVKAFEALTRAVVLVAQEIPVKDA